ncbi:MULTISPECIES: metalloregulator ArsR/SmtB family transcription factor [unclassified Salinibacterium]|uniref:ArsR/SmtB family transcription factor n=1 Tax=Salinibacterium sp. GXW1014 TaxID=3377838 RepID=UPI0019DC5B46|nr:metalloregulator ArsR/SmtB family transcription factor [Salinibacterium sp.]MBF0671418.1 helix-turn-helix transcriptional regulator [Salinibacterium sp.]
MNLPTSDLPVAQVKAELFKAMGHPARIRVLEALSEGERTVGEIAGMVDLEMSTLSQQLAVLRRAGVVTTRRQGNSIHYALRDERMSQLLAIARQIIVSNLRDSREMLESLDRRP